MRGWSEGVARLRAAVARSSPRAIAGIGYALFLLYAFPGYMSNDSVVQLVEARRGWFTDGHPPIMAAEWRLLDALVSGPLLMLLLQSALFLVGVIAILRRWLSPRAAALAGACVLLFPPVMTPMAVIWKDAQMAAYLVVGVAALLSERRRNRVLGLVLVTVGCAFRHNGFAASVPLVFVLFELTPGRRWWARYALSLVAAVLSVGVALGVDHVLADEHHAITPAFGDIEGVLEFTHDRTDDDLRQVFAGTTLRVTTGIQAHARTIFSPRNSIQVTRGPDRLFDDPKTPAQWAALDRAWKELVLGDVRAYLHFRLAAFAELLGLSDAGLMAPVWNVFLEAPEEIDWIDHQASWSPLQAHVGHVLYWLADDTPLFRPYVYVAIALLLLALCCRDRLTFALLGSGLTYELSFFPAAGTPDYRYSHWLIVCACLAAIVLFVQRYRRARA
jgi:hypothetical protein